MKSAISIHMSPSSWRGFKVSNTPFLSSNEESVKHITGTYSLAFWTMRSSTYEQIKEGQTQHESN